MAVILVAGAVTGLVFLTIKLIRDYKPEDDNTVYNNISITIYYKHGVVSIEDEIKIATGTYLNQPQYAKEGYIVEWKILNGAIEDVENYDELETPNFPMLIESDINLIGIWEADPNYTSNYCNVFIAIGDAGGDYTITDEKRVRKGIYFNEPQYSKEHYELLWMLLDEDSEEFGDLFPTFPMLVNKDVYLIGVWMPDMNDPPPGMGPQINYDVQYEISFISDIPSYSYETTLPYYENVQLDYFELEDPNDEYIFIGWYTKDGSVSGDWGEEVEFPFYVTENRTFYAKWQLNN